MAARALDKRDWDTLLRKVYDHWGDQPSTTSRGELAEQLHEPVRALQSLLAVMRHVGIAEQGYQRHPSGRGRASIYRLVVPYEEAVARLETFGYSQIRSFKQQSEDDGVALASDGGAVRAIAGPDRSSPFEVLRPLRRDESHAQVEAARRYRDRMSFIEGEVRRFEDMGIKVKPGAFKFVRDVALEYIVPVLPYIESLEKENANLARQHEVGVASDDMRQQYQQLHAENQRLRSRVKDLVSQNATLRDELARRPRE